MTNSDSLHADLWWCHIFRSIVTSGDLKQLSGAAIKIYIALKTRANIHTGEADVGHDRIARECGLSVSSVKRGLADLKKKGYVISRDRPGHASTYMFIERFPVINLDGDVAATATFRFIGKKLKERRLELMKILEKGVFPDSSPTIKIDVEVTNQLIFNGNNITINGNVINGSLPSTELPARNGKILEKHLLRTGFAKIDDIVFHSQVIDDLADE